MRELVKSRAQLFINLSFISSVRVRFEVRVLELGLVVGLGLALIILTCRTNLVLQVIWLCDVFGMTSAKARA